MTTIESTHGMSHEVDASAACSVLKDAIEILCPRGNRTGTFESDGRVNAGRDGDVEILRGYARDDDLCAELVL